MSGIDISRIIGWDSKYAQTLQCAICLLILDNPIITECGHNYCYHCLKAAVKSGSDVCPKCRKELTRKRSIDHSNNVFIANNRHIYVFTKNLSLREVIGKLKVECEYAFNGCEKSVDLDELSDHLLDCEHKLCHNCGLTAGRPEDHNCLELMKSERNDWKEKYEKGLMKITALETRLDDITTKCNVSENTIRFITNENQKLRRKNHYLKGLQSESEHKCEDFKKKNEDLRREYTKLIQQKEDIVSDWRRKYDSLADSIMSSD